MKQNYLKIITLLVLLLVLCCAISNCGGTASNNNLSHSSVSDGYTDKVSYDIGEEIVFYLNSNVTANVQLTIYDIDSKPVDSLIASVKPQKITNSVPSSNGYGYQPTVTYLVTGKLKSGIYLLENKIRFIIKDTKHTSKLLVLYPTNTINAYNCAGGNSLYTENAVATVSFQRPLDGSNMPIYADPFVQWINSHNYDVGFLSDQDMDNYAEIENAQVLVVIGHSEYWSRKARINFDRLIESGKHALVLSGNTMWWQVRYSEDGSKMICYKNYYQDPITDPLMKTVNWDNVNLNYSILQSIGGDFVHGGYGWRPTDAGWDGFKISNGNSPLLYGTGLKRGDILSFWTHEYDGTEISGYDANGFPIMDLNKLGFHKGEIIGFDYGERGDQKTVGTFIVFQKKTTSGIVINVSSTNWCGANGIGGSDQERIKKITANSIDLLLNNKNVF